MVVEADDIGFAASAQCTTVLFKPMLTESIDKVEIRDELVPLAEILMKVNIVEFTSLCQVPLIGISAIY